MSQFYDHEMRTEEMPHREFESDDKLRSKRSKQRKRQRTAQQKHSEFDEDHQTLQWR